METVGGEWGRKVTGGRWVVGRRFTEKVVGGRPISNVRGIDRSM